MRKIELKNNELSFSEKVLGFLEREVKPIGNSGKVDCPKRFIGKRAYIIVCEDEFRKKSKKAGRGKQETEGRKSFSKANNSGIDEED